MGLWFPFFALLAIAAFYVGLSIFILLRILGNGVFRRGK